MMHVGDIMMHVGGYHEYHGGVQYSGGKSFVILVPPTILNSLQYSGYPPNVS